MEQEHAADMNRTAGGLQVYGNVIPATDEANRPKGGLRYDEFLRSKAPKHTSIAHLSNEQREEAIGRIKVFRQAYCSPSALDAHPALLAFYQRQYEQAKAFCVTAADELDELLQQLYPATLPSLISGEEQVWPSSKQLEREEQGAGAPPLSVAAIWSRVRDAPASGQELKIGVALQVIMQQLDTDEAAFAALRSLPDLDRRLRMGKELTVFRPFTETDDLRLLRKDTSGYNRYYADRLPRLQVLFSSQWSYDKHYATWDSVFRELQLLEEER